MYEKLIKALREAHEHAMEWERNPFRYAALYKVAADAIEQLIEERDAYRKAMTHEHNRAAYLAWEKEHCWIPVTERLPEAGERVLCYCRANIYEVMKMRTDGAWVHNDKVYDSAYMSGFVTHWMPLPPAPKEET